LKKAYLKAALKNHPDRGGSQELFQQISIAYSVLLKKLESEQYNDHNSLKQNYNKSLNQTKPTTYDNKKFDIDVFNKIYDENKLETIYDKGYGDWMSKSSENNQPKKMFQGEFNKDLFNHEFEKYKQSKQKTNSNNIVVRNLKENISYCNSDSIVHLGQKEIDNFTGESGGLGFTDLKDAYENSTLINPNIIDISKRENNINSLKANRKQINYNISDADLRRLNIDKQEQLEKEKDRIDRIKKTDELIFNNYHKIHNRLVNN